MAVNLRDHVSTSPALSWNKTAGANNYRLEVNTNPDFIGTVIFDNSSIADTIQALSGLSYNTTYYWRVTASSNSLAKTTTSDVYSFTTKLATVTLVSPANNSTGINLTPALTWTEIAGADKYRLEINTSPDFNNKVIYDQDTVSLPSTQVSGLFDNTTYYWRVTALNNGGNSSDVSGTFYFATRATTGVEPLNGSKAISTSPTLKWNRTIGASSYRLEVNTNPDFSNTVIFDNSLITDTIHVLTGLSNNTTYYWRITANSNSLAKTKTSDIYSFTTKLATVTPTSPANNSTGISLVPVLSWTAIPGADKYRLEVNTKIDFSGIIIYDQDTVSMTTKKIGGLFDNITYYWRVTAINNNGNSSDLSNTFSFTTRQTELVVATNGATFVSTSPSLVWNKISGATGYRLEVNINPDFSGIVIYDNASITDTLQALTGLNNNTTYYWRVTAYSNSLTKTTLSDVYSFTTKLAKVNLISPVRNSNGISLSPVIEWTSVPGADRYRLEVNTRSDFKGTVIYDLDTVNSTSKQIGGLFDNTSYYWRVTAFNNSGNASDPSDTLAFTTIAGNSIEPINGATFISTSPTLIWNKISGADNYRLEVNTQSDFTGTNISDSLSIKDTLLTLSDLSNNTTYYWRVTAYSNNLSKITTSDTYNFTTKLASVNLISPVHNSTGIPLSPILSWTAVEGADRYRLEVNIEADFNSRVVYDQDTLSLPLQQIETLSSSTNYFWRVTALNNRKNSSDASSTFGFITASPTDILTFSNIIPQEYKLFQNYPNPFNPTTTIRYALPLESNIRISLYDVLGQEVKLLYNSTKSAGYHELTFDATNLASGIYFFRISATSTREIEAFVDTKKLMLMK